MSDVFKQAARVIERNGHHKGGYYLTVDADPADCPVCALGALSIVMFDRPYPGFPDNGKPEEFDRMAMKLADRLGLSYDPDTIDSAAVAIGAWNDADERTEQDVINALNSMN